MTETGLKVGLTFLTLVLYMVYLANKGGMLTPWQMINISKIKEGFPLFAKGDLWGNALLLPVAFGLIVAFCGDQWKHDDLFCAAIIGAIGAVEMIANVYMPGKYADALVGAGVIHPAGTVLGYYLAGAIALLLLFGLSSSPWWLTLMVGLILAVYIVVANHVPLVHLRSVYHWEIWCPDVFKEEAKPMLTIFVSEAAIFVVVVLKILFPGGLLKIIHS